MQGARTANIAINAFSLAWNSSCEGRKSKQPLIKARMQLYMCEVVQVNNPVTD